MNCSVWRCRRPAAHDALCWKHLRQRTADREREQKRLGKLPRPSGGKETK